MRHITRIEDISDQDLEAILSKASDMRTAVREKNVPQLLVGRVMAALFYEPSSRTYGSFVSAMQRLGGGVIGFPGMLQSSVAKGETLEDTIQTFAGLSDVIVLRHPELGSSDVAARVSTVPLINAGDGAGEHPTQALLDVFTIQDHFKDMSSLTITFSGDLLYGRTVHSLVQLIARKKPKQILLVSPSELRLPQEFKTMLEKSGVSVQETEDLTQALSVSDVVYMTRVQKERFTDSVSYERLKDKFQITPSTLATMKSSAVLMHPLPRITEITPDVDADPKAIYFREQIPNGLYVRMAILSLLLT